MPLNEWVYNRLDLPAGTYRLRNLATVTPCFPGEK
jgi:hypothetical protein